MRSVKGRVQAVVFGGIGVLALGAIALGAEAIPQAPQFAPSLPNVTTTVVEVESRGVTLACPPQIIDPVQSTEVEGEQAHAGQMELAALSDGGSALVTTLQTGAPVVFSGNKGGDLAGFLVDSCLFPSRFSTLLPAATVVGEQSVLILTNPGDTPVEVDVFLYGPLGPLGEVSANVLVGAQSTELVLPATLAPREEVVAVSVQADGAGIAAWLQTSGLDGEVPLGVSRMGAFKPSPTQVVSGLDPDSVETLSVFNPNDEMVTVDINVVGEDQYELLGGTEDLQVPPSSVSTVDLAGLPAGTQAIEVIGSGSVAAAVVQKVEGKAHGDVRGQKVMSRSVIAGSAPVMSAAIPPVAALEEISKYMGDSDPTFKVGLTNTEQADADVQVGGKEVVVPARSSLTLEGSPDMGDLQVKQGNGIYFTYIAVVDTAVGQVSAGMPLGPEGSSGQERVVTLFPFLAAGS